MSQIYRYTLHSIFTCRENEAELSKIDMSNFERAENGLFAVLPFTRSLSLSLSRSIELHVCLFANGMVKGNPAANSI